MRIKRNSSIHLALTGSIVFLLALVSYIKTLQPTLGGNTYDSEEFQHIAYTLGIAHPTGYPLYLLLGKLWITLLPFGNVAYRMNLFSAVLTATAAVIFFLALFELIRQRLPAFLGAIFLALSQPIWHHAVAASVGPLNLLLLASLLLALLLWRRQRLGLIVPALIFGFTLAHHRSSLALIPGILVLLAVPRKASLRLRDYAWALLALGAPLLLYLYLPLRGNASPWYDNTVSAFLRHIGGADTIRYTANSASQWIENTILFLQLLNTWLTYVGLFMALLGVITVWQIRRASAQDNYLFLSLGVMTLGCVAFGVSVSGEVERYLAPALMFFVIWATLGVAALVRRFEFSTHSSMNGDAAPRWTRLRVGRGSALSTVFLGAVLLNALLIYPLVDQSQNDRTYRFWDEILALPLEPGAVILGNWSELNALRYMQSVEGRRPDLRQVGIVDTRASVDAGIEFAQTMSDNVYLPPSAPLPAAEYHYRSLGPLLRVSQKPDYQPPAPPVTSKQAIGQFELVGYGVKTSLHSTPERDTTAVEPGQSVRLSLYWHVKEPVKSDYAVRVRLLDAEGIALWQKTEPPLRDAYPTSRWQIGSYVTDNHGIFIPPGTPPGVYEIEAALVDAETRTPLTPRTHMSVNVVRSSVPLADQIFNRTPLAQDWGNLRLMGLNPGGHSVQRGETLNFSLIWLAREKLTTDYSLQFRLVNETGSCWETIQFPVLRNLPTSEWQKNDAFRVYYTLPIPADAPLGVTHAFIELVDLRTGQIMPAQNHDSVKLFTFSIEP